MASMTLYYWGIKARNYAIVACAQHCGIQLTQVTNPDLAAMKPELPFGQLPYLVHGDIKIAQSMAILRYVARIGGVLGDSDADFAMSEMLIEESTDIGNSIGKAMYSADRVESFNTLFSAEGEFAKHLANLEKLHPSGTEFFCSKRVAGGFAMAAVLDLAVNLESTCLDAFPKMKAFHAAMLASPAFDGVRDYPMYYKRTA